MNDPLPSIDESAYRLHAKGWSTGDAALDYPTGRVWVVSCWREGYAFNVEAPTQLEAWARDCLKGEAMEN